MKLKRIRIQVLLVIAVSLMFICCFTRTSTYANESQQIDLYPGDIYTFTTICSGISSMGFDKESCPIEVISTNTNTVRVCMKSFGIGPNGLTMEIGVHAVSVGQANVYVHNKVTGVLYYTSLVTVKSRTMQEVSACKDQNIEFLVKNESDSFESYPLYFVEEGNEKAEIISAQSYAYDSPGMNMFVWDYWSYAHEDKIIMKYPETGIYHLSFYDREEHLVSEYTVTIKEHNYSSNTESEATCKDKKKIRYTCENCKAFYIEETGEFAPHNWMTAYTVDKKETCTEMGSKTIHCSVCDLSKEGSEIEIPPKGHDWDIPEYVWSEDNKTVIATCICKNDASHKETETVDTISEITKQPTYADKGETTYTATFTNELFTTQTKSIIDIPVLSKKTNPLKVTPKAITGKTKATVKIVAKKAFTVKDAQGKVTYKVTKYDKKAKKKITISKSGTVTVKKGLKKGTYKVRVKVSAKGTVEYNAGNKTLTLTIKIK